MDVWRNKKNVIKILKYKLKYTLGNICIKKTKITIKVFCSIIKIRLRICISKVNT